jgi:hypothetical protein
MIKDLVDHLSCVGSPRRPDRLRFPSPRRSGAHVSGVTFSYEPVIPPTIMGSIPASLIEHAAPRERQGGERRAREIRRGGEARDDFVRIAAS